MTCNEDTCGLSLPVSPVHAKAELNPNQTLWYADRSVINIVPLMFFNAISSHTGWLLPPVLRGRGTALMKHYGRFDLIFLLAHIFFFFFFQIEKCSWNPKAKKNQGRLMREKIKPECYSTHAFTDMTLELLKGNCNGNYSACRLIKTHETKVITTIRKWIL